MGAGIFKELSEFRKTTGCSVQFGKNAKNVENVKMKIASRVPLVAKRSEGHEGRRQAGPKGLQQKSGPGDF